ncbi:hypothetical protein [Haloplanus aerogenes]|uniref:Uncharacterized protein n=1 Tax=Haloplanus aerogenes TaxID=660522 RepID=A0A3M0CUS2_9EURY|nr:hypothetical protein [Haloplanus aerogenes]AZH26577.1 hypothetical protein DU502_14875 [Haloplanus aerogenes]RMB12807.1 hypothetical protein ATH50_2961 [Haloplanus aerogenes]
MASFFDRFVHPRIARVATAGALLWAGSFLVAVAGLVIRGGQPNTAATLFFLSGVVGLVGMLVLAGCGCYLFGMRLRQKIGAYYSQL